MWAGRLCSGRSTSRLGGSETIPTWKDLTWPYPARARGLVFSGSALAPLDHPQAEAGGRSGGRGTSWSTKRAPHFGSYSPAGASSSAPGAVASEAVEQLV